MHGGKGTSLYERILVLCKLHDAAPRETASRDQWLQYRDNFRLEEVDETCFRRSKREEESDALIERVNLSAEVGLRQLDKICTLVRIVRTGI